MAEHSKNMQRKAQGRAQKMRCSWRSENFHMLLSFEASLNPVYAEGDGRPLLQDIYDGSEPSTGEIVTVLRLVVAE